MSSVQEYAYKFEQAFKQKDTFLVTDRKISVWFNIFNQAIFNQKLPKFHQIKLIEKNIPYYGLCEVNSDDEYILELQENFPNKKLFLEILIHEMIHLHEYIKYGKMSHGSNFLKWRKKLNRFGLDLKRVY